MRAIIYEKYGPPEVLQLKEVEKPIPGKNEVCIKIHASAVTASDIFIRGSQVPWHLLIPMRLMLGLRKPRKPIIGLVLSGEIESVGKNTTKFKPGDQVFGLTGYGLGAYAEYKCMRETDSTYGCLALKPVNTTHEEATMVAYGGLLALQFLRKGNIEKREKVLIYGASGTTGILAIQLAKHYGAEVTAICGTSNIELVKSFGADNVLDYTKRDALIPGERYDLVLDAVGKMKTSKLKVACKSALYPTGKYVSIDNGTLKLNSESLTLLTNLCETEKISPVLDRSYPLSEITAAHNYVGAGHKKGGVAITIVQNQ